MAQLTCLRWYSAKLHYIILSWHRKSMTKIDTDDETVRKDIKELKMNLKRQMGEKYETLG